MNQYMFAEERTLNAVRSLRADTSSDSKQMRELTVELKTLKSVSKSFSTCTTPEPTLSQVRHRLLEIDRCLLQLCEDSEHLHQLQQLCHHGDERSPDPEKLLPDSYGLVVDVMREYEVNCKQKEDLENLVNQVHMKLLKAEKVRGNCDQKPPLTQSKSLESSVENISLKHKQESRRNSVETSVHYQVSLFPDLSQDILEIAQQEYRRRRPLQSLQYNRSTKKSIDGPMNSAGQSCQFDWSTKNQKYTDGPIGVAAQSDQFDWSVPKQKGSIGPIRIARSPEKKENCDSNTTPCTEEHETYSTALSRVNLSRSLSRVRSPMLNSILKKEKVSQDTNQ